MKTSEGGPGSGPHSNGGGKPHYYSDKPFMGSRPNTLPLDNQIAKINNDAFFDKRSLTDDEKKTLNDLELQRRRKLMYQSEAQENSIAIGPAHIGTYPLPKGEILSGGSLASTGTTLHPAEAAVVAPACPLGLGGKLGVKSSSQEADSGSSFPQALRAQDEEK